MSGPSGSITTENVLRADPRRIGAKKSLRTSIRGHSATQKVACTMASTRTADQLSSMAMGHGSLTRRRHLGEGAVRLIGPQELAGEVHRP